MPLIDYVAISFLYKNLAIGMSMCVAENVFLVVYVAMDSIEGFFLWVFVMVVSI